MNLLIIDDEENIRCLIKKFAQKEGYKIYEATNGQEGIDLIFKQNIPIHCAIIDLMMPKLNGFETCQIIRENSNIPIIILTARNDDFDKYHGFEIGADDYLSKPFSPLELMYRINALIKRAYPSQQDEIKINPNFIINTKSRQIIIHEKTIDLSLKEYDLLLLLIDHENIVLEREQILNQVWGYDFYGDDRTLDTHIKLLRKKINPFQKYIKTVRGVGYKFEQERSQ